MSYVISVFLIAETIFETTRLACVCETRMPWWQQCQNMAKSLLPAFNPVPSPGACYIYGSEIWATPKLQSKFGNANTIQTFHFIQYFSRMELWTDWQMNRQTDGHTVQLLDAPSGPFNPGA